MFSIAFRYIFKKLLSAFCVVAPIVILVIWITMSIKYVGLIASDNISFSMFFRLVFCTLPGISAVVLPICFLISSIVALQKMHADQEVIVLLTSGKSSLSLAFPLIALGSLVAGFVLYLHTIASPLAYKHFENLQEEIKNKVSVALLKPGTFNVVGESVIYIGKRENNQLENVFVSYIPGNQKSRMNIISAKEGQYLSEEGNITVLLKNGYRQELDRSGGVLATLKFENFSYDITGFFKRFYARPKRANEKTQSELIQQANETKDLELKRRYISEYHSRYLYSFVPVFNSLITSLFLLIAIGRGRSNIASSKSFVCGVLFQILIMILVNISTKDSVVVYYNYVAVFLLASVLFIAFRRRG